ncbi:MAG: hypothetical protein GY838_14335 [bacterium]|nr:hypothetical protein [bacterium]
MESMVVRMALVAVGVYILNVPFGYWREDQRKFSLLWFVFIHASIPGVIALRIVSGLGFSMHSYPILLAAYFLGQFTGSHIRRRKRARAAAE